MKNTKIKELMWTYRGFHLRRPRNYHIPGKTTNIWYHLNFVLRLDVRLNVFLEIYIRLTCENLKEYEQNTCLSLQWSQPRAQWYCYLWRNFQNKYVSEKNIIYESDYSLKNSVKALLIFQVEGIPVLILQCVGTLLVYRGERYQELQYQNDNWGKFFSQPFTYNVGVNSQG